MTSRRRRYTLNRRHPCREFARSALGTGGMAARLGTPPRCDFRIAESRLRRFCGGRRRGLYAADRVAFRSSSLRCYRYAVQRASRSSRQLCGKSLDLPAHSCGGIRNRLQIARSELGSRSYREHAKCAGATASDPCRRLEHAERVWTDLRRDHFGRHNTWACCWWARLSGGASDASPIDPGGSDLVTFFLCTQRSRPSRGRQVMA